MKKKGIKILHQGEIIEIFQQEVEINGKKKIFEFAQRAPGVRLIILKGKKILLTKEFRHEINTWDYRLPGGKVFDTLLEYKVAVGNGINIKEVAKEAVIRESEEEVGIKPKNIKLFSISHSGATIIWDLYYFVIDAFEQLESQKLELGESITYDWYDVETVTQMCLEGKLQEDRSVSKLLQFIHKQKK